jgi:hypothetical protein
MNSIEYILPNLILNKTCFESIIDYEKTKHKDLQKIFDLCVNFHVCYRCGKQKRIREFKKTKHDWQRKHSIYCIECDNAMNRLFLCKKKLRIYKIKNDAKNLTDKYISWQLKISVNELKEYPELIEVKRLQLQIKRTLK